MYDEWLIQIYLFVFVIFPSQLEFELICIGDVFALIPHKTVKKVTDDIKTLQFICFNFKLYFYVFNCARFI
jgi:hypothetical protein